jgi:hypothetical protein
MRTFTIGQSGSGPMSAHKKRAAKKLRVGSKLETDATLAGTTIRAAMSFATGRRMSRGDG